MSVTNNSRSDGRGDRPAGLKRIFLLLSAVILLVGGAAPLQASITKIEGNTVGGPPVKLEPCPAHNTNWCQSQLTSTVSLITTPSIWFQNTLQGNYNAPDWKFHFVGGGDKIKGTFFVDSYLAYNDCGKAQAQYPYLGAQIVVDFNAASDSPIQDVLWLQTLYFTEPGKTTSYVDDRNLLIAWGNLPQQEDTMYGPFYPYQDEDEDLPLWQTSYPTFDYFGDRPGVSCPEPGTSKSMYFETYACYWDDYFNADGSMTDVGGDGHNVYIHEGFYWSYQASCAPIPAPGAALLGAFGFCICNWLHRRKTI